MNDTPKWLREFRAALKEQARESIARLGASMGETPEEQARSLAAIIAASLPRKR